MEYGKHDVRFEADKNHPGESYNDIVARFMPFIGRLEERYRDTGASVLLISHGQTLALMLPLLLSNVDWAYSSTHTFDGTFHAVAELRNGEWVCLRWGEETMAE
jgi:broad specificity phosphatase PhoE